MGSGSRLRIMMTKLILQSGTNIWKGQDQLHDRFQNLNNYLLQSEMRTTFVTVQLKFLLNSFFLCMCVPDFDFM